MQGGPSSIPGQGTRARMPQLKVLRAATKTWCSQINKLILKQKREREWCDFTFPGGRLLIHLAPLGNCTTLCGGDSLCPESLLPRWTFIYGEEQQSKTRHTNNFLVLMLHSLSINESFDPTQVYDLHFAVRFLIAMLTEDSIFIRNLAKSQLSDVELVI